MEKDGFAVGVISSLMKKKISFNFFRFSNPGTSSSKKIDVTSEKFVELHSQIVKKVDALIAANERELFTEEIEFILLEKNDLNTETVLPIIKDNKI
jgi:hypothetical protein